MWTLLLIPIALAQTDYVAHYTGIRNVTASFALKWFEQEKDHFSFEASDTGDNGGHWKQRYYINSDFATKTGPILFYPGNEADIVLFIEGSGALYYWAEFLGATVVFAEHRFYGHSFPVFADDRNRAFEKGNTRLLTIAQAMEDFAALAKHLQQSLGGDNPIFPIGGSYGAALASFLRTKYPHRFAGAVASAASLALHKFIYNNAFNRRVADVYRNVSEDCFQQLRSGTQVFLKVGTPGYPTISDATRALGLCDGVIASRDDIPRVYNAIIDATETLVQYGYPYPSRFSSPKEIPAYPFAEVCRVARRHAGPLAAFAAVLDIYYRDGSKCVTLMEGADDGPFDPLMMLAWTYQTCTEVYQPMPTDGVTDFMPPSVVNETEIFDNCRRMYGVVPRKTAWEDHFGGCNMSTASNIWYTYGEYDPWTEGGCFNAHNPASDVFVVLLPKAAHHLDLRYPHPAEVKEIWDVRAAILASLRKWTIEWSRRRLEP